ncbi:MAG: gliding motility-associated C-terminal domain-containing protein [Bacteroidetes bacterium]|nr:gliding motility-associated C-terminal domain-containing protein [Bacteroidota bacterium]
MKRICFFVVLFFYFHALISQISGIEVNQINCKEDSLKIKNNASWGKNWNWHFATYTGIHKDPIFKNLGNIGGILNSPSFCCAVTDNGKCYLFLTQYGGALVRYDFGSTFSGNNPKAINLGSFSGALPSELSGIQIIKENGQWIGFVVGGNPTGKLIRLEWGNNIENIPILTDLGNMGGLAWPHSLSLFSYKKEWVAFAANRKSSSFTRIEFGNSLLNNPSAYKIQPTGVKNGLTDFKIIKDEKDSFHIFTAELLGQKFIQIILGTDLKNNNPTVINYGNLANAMTNSRGVLMLQDCDGWHGYVNDENEHTTRIDFPNGITGKVVSKNLGDVNNVKTRYSDFCQPIRIRDTIYSFISHPDINSVARATWVLSVVDKWAADQNIKTPVPFAPKSSGTFPLHVILDEFSPMQSDSCFFIEFKPCCSVKIYGKKWICNQDSTTLSAVGSGSSGNYKWYFKNSLIATNSTIKVNKPGLYVVRYQNDTCPLVSDSVVVNQDNIILNKDTTIVICPGDSLLLDPGNAVFYRWVPKSLFANETASNQWIQTQTEAYIYCVGIGNFGCTDTCIFDIQLFTPTASGLPDTVLLCAGDTFELYAKNFNQNKWNNSDTNTKQLVWGNGRITWEGMDVNGCKSKDTIVAEVNAAPIIADIQDTSICNGIAFQYLLPENNWRTTYLLKPTTPISNNKIIFHSAGNYVLIASNACGMDQDSFQIKMDTCNKCDFYIPDAFTPGLDGINDFYVTAADCKLLSGNYRVFNRWGELLFQSAQLNASWDGNFMGKPCPEGVYVLVADFRVYINGIEKEFQKAYTFHLLRPH